MARKFYNIQKLHICFKLKSKETHHGIDIICATQNTNYGFRHVILDMMDHQTVLSKRCYYNRTWERWTYESVIEDYITHKYKDKLTEPVERYDIEFLSR